MKLSLVGMSGSGKSYWSQKLQEEKGFKRFCCDDMIEQLLKNESNTLGYSGIRDVARWMGQPFDPQYAETSRKYLDFEKLAMQKILDEIRVTKGNSNIVIDTTGSVIYLGERILNKLSALTKVVYLNTPASVQREMYQLYLEDPKPVIWGDLFSKIDRESNLEALSRCYQNLLSFRSRKYKRIADVELNYHDIRTHDYNTDRFLKEVKNG